MFENSTDGFIELVLNSANTVILAVHIPHMNATAGGGSDEPWAGYEITANPNNLITHINFVQVKFTVPTNSTPTQHKNANCCFDPLWVGLGDVSGATDNVLIQGGVSVGDGVFDQYVSGGTTYHSPYFFYEGLLTTIPYTPWASTCLKVSYGDSVNTTLNHGTYGSSGQYDMQFVYGDNDAHSTCAVYWYMSYTITPTWAYYIYEALKDSRCTYTGNVCQTIQFSTITYTAELNIGFSWFGAFANSNNYNYYAWTMHQGIDNVVAAKNSGTTYTNTWKTSQQI